MHTFLQPVMGDGRVLEGRGVTPDIEVELEPDMLLRGVDVQLQTAVASVANQ